MTRAQVLALYNKGVDAVYEHINQQAAELEKAQQDLAAVAHKQGAGQRVKPSAGNKVMSALLTVATFGVVRFFLVPQGHIVLVTLFGKYLREVQPGLGTCLSFFGLLQTPSDPIYVMERVKDFPKEEVFIRNGTVKIDTVVFYRIIDTKKATYDIDDFEVAVRNLVQATLRNECGHLAFTDLLASRNQIATRLQKTLEQGSSDWGLAIRLVELRGIESVQQRSS